MASRFLLRSSVTSYSKRTYSTNVPPPKISKSSSTFNTLALTTLTAATFYAVGSFYPPSLLKFLAPRPAPAPPPADSPEGKAMVENVENQIQVLKVVKKAREENVAKEGWYETRPHQTKNASPHSLTSTALKGPGKLTIPPILFASPTESSSLIVLHVGRSVCGHDGIVHGGLIATILDEATGRQAILSLPSKLGVTAKLEIQYRKPTIADQFLVIETELKEQKGRKAIVESKLYNLDNELLAEATALYVEPKWAKMLANSGVKEMLGVGPELGKKSAQN